MLCKTSSFMPGKRIFVQSGVATPALYEKFDPIAARLTVCETKHHGRAFKIFFANVQAGQTGNFLIREMRSS
jgi:hypothetical protein